MNRPPDTRDIFLRAFPSIVLPMFLAVIDQTMVAAALPAIALSLGGVERLSWVVIAYLVSTTIAAPVYGRLGDLMGRRRLMLVALVIFIAGSAICALSQSIEMLAAARVVQGAGGGGLMTLSQALIGELIPPRERAQYQGYLASVAVTSVALGPLVGGLLTQHFGWQAVFLVNIPVGILATFLALRIRAGTGTGERLRFDGLGLVLFASFITSMLVMLQQAQRVFAGDWPLAAGLALVAAVSAVLLVWRESRAPLPLLPLPLLKHPAIWRCDALSACHGAMLVALLTFLPLYFRLVHGTSPVETGLLLLPVTTGIGLGSLITGRLVARTGRSAIFPSVGLIVVAVLLVVIAFAASRLSPTQIAWAFGLNSVFLGTVMGVVQLTVQLAAGAQQLGTGAASVQFSRTLGAAIGTALVGAVLFAALAAAGLDAAAFTRLLQQGPEALLALPPAAAEAAARGLDEGFRYAFLCTAGFAAFGIYLAWSLPIRRL